MRLVIFSQCRDWRMGVMWLDLGAVTTARAREFRICKAGLSQTWAGCDKDDSCSSQAWSEQWKWQWWKLFWYQGMDGYSEAGEYGNSKIWRQMRSGEKKWGVHQIWSRDFKQNESCWVRSCCFWQVVYWDQWAEIQSWRRSVLEDLQTATKRFDFWRWSMLESKWVGRKEKKQCHLCRGDGLGNMRKWGYWEEWCTWQRVVDQG